MIIIIEKSRTKKESEIIQSKFDDFRRIFPSNVTHYLRILKILIFITSIIKIYKLYNIIRTEQLPKLNYLKKAGNQIKTYYLDIPDFDKQTITDEFKKPDNINKKDIQSLYRILIIINTYSMGVDNSDIINIW